MAQRIMQSDEEEYDAKQPPARAEADDAWAKQTKQMIMGINSRKRIQYIQDLCYARMDLARAQEALDKDMEDDAKGKLNNCSPCCVDADLPDELPPVKL